MPKTLIQILKFGVVGLSATATHAVVATLYLSQIGGTAFNANLLGFSVAFSISFFGNALWVFRTPGRLRAAAARFLTLSLLVLCVSLTISAGFDYLAWNPYASLPVVLLVGPIISFLGNKLWVFGEVPPVAGS